MKSIGLIALGGGLGALGRWALIALIPGHLFPTNIFVINLLGSFFLGLVLSLAVEYSVVQERGRLFLAVGVMGGFTTFSTFMLGSLSLIRAGSVPTALIYLMASVVLGVVAVWAGFAIPPILLRRLTAPNE